MKRSKLNQVSAVLFFVSLIALCHHTMQGQGKTIDLPDALRESAEVYTYRLDKLKNGFMKNNWKKPLVFFGPYTLHNYDKDNLESKARSNFFGTRLSQSELKEWSYEIHSEGMDPMDVTVAYNFSESLAGSIQPIDNIPIVFGEDELLNMNLQVSVFMGFDYAAEDPWLLLISLSEGSETRSEYLWELTNGKRKFDIVPVVNEVRNKFKQQFAMYLDVPRGFVFWENEKPVAAFQWCAYNNKKHTRVWMDKGLSPDLQMALSATMSSILLLSNDVNFFTRVMSRSWF